MKRVEEKWQKKWAESRIFEADPKKGKPKFFLTVAYPYPNSPQHIGHGRTYSLTDVYARYMRMKGLNVLFPMAFHYTGTPILAMAKRLREGDKELLNVFTEIYRIPEEEINGLMDPFSLARYFHSEIREGMKRMGYSIDWRREFTTIDPLYNKFITWQFHRLHGRGYLTKGRHPVGWCPRCGNAVGQHDTVGDVEPEIEETTLIKFKSGSGETVLPAVTFRPETVFGVTNIWVNPDVEYLVTDVNGEKWIVSEEAALKLRFQGLKVEEKGRINGKDLIGWEAVNPATNERIPVLPAKFVDPRYGSGVVMSVPGHAPFDYLALKDLKSRFEEAEKYGLEKDVLEELKPVSIIEVEGFSEYPARDAVESLGVTSQDDPRAEEATKTVYSKEYHLGVMKGNTGKYAGLRVSEAKERVKKDFVTDGKALTFYEIANSPVVCRCGAKVVVKIVEDQWFIDYSNPEWKRMVRECLKEMKILPGEMKKEFQESIEWIREKACARRSGLGTPLPWDPSWIIESLSDSTIYMAYYTISKYLNQGRVKPEQFDLRVFNYIFLGEGDPEEISEEKGLPLETLEEMREEFEYWYPLDSRHSGRDLVWNHLTFFIFNHVAIFRRKHWPRQIVVNGSVMMEGKKMSKSLGNIIPIREAVEMFGADVIRISVLGTAELLSDADFSFTVAKSTRSRLEKLFNLVKKYPGQVKPVSKDKMDMWDKWILSKLQKHVISATKALEECRTREALHNVFYLMDQDVSRYLEASTGKDEDVVKSIMQKVLNVWVRLLAPFAPHLCEEMWSLMGNEEFISVAPWPEPEEGFLDEETEKAVMFIDKVIEDAREIIRLVRVKPSKLHVYIASEWKFELLNEIMELKKRIGEINPKIILDELMKKEIYREKSRVVVKTINMLIKSGEWTWLENREVEMKAVEEAADYIGKTIGVKVEVQSEEKPVYDPWKRASRALPGKPALYAE